MSIENEIWTDTDKQNMGITPYNMEVILRDNIPDFANPQLEPLSSFLMMKQRL
jgi:hypothetical protein